METAKRDAGAYLGSLNTYQSYVASGKEAVVVTYERLSDPRTRVQELTKVVSFLGTGWTAEDVECAFDAPQGSNSLRARAHDDDAATLVDAYPVKLACEMWRKHLKCVFRLAVPHGRVDRLHLLTLSSAGRIGIVARAHIRRRGSRNAKQAQRGSLS